MSDGMPPTRSSEKVTRWTIETWVSLFGVAIVIAGAISGYAVLRFQVAQLEDGRVQLEQRNGEVHKDYSLRLEKLESDQQSTDHAYDHRLTIVETQYSEILTQLKSINDKIDRKGH